MTDSYETSAPSLSSMSSKMTPQSSSTSTVDASARSRHVSSGSILLEEKLKEKRAESLRVKKRPTKSIFGQDDEPQYTQSSPVGRKGSFGYEKDTRRPSTSGSVGMTSKKSLGAKQMEDTLDALHKQNFDLKLQLFHRIEKQTALEKYQEELEAKLANQEERLAKQDSELIIADEIQEMNDRLVLELEKRDQAVGEAVNKILQMEEEVEALKRDRSIVKSFDATYTPIHTESDQSLIHHEIPSSPPTGGGRSRLDHMPSFLSDGSEGVDTLRSVYQHNIRQALSSDSLPLLPEEDREGMASPSLSILSQSSFLSVYGNQNEPQNYSPSNREGAPSPESQDGNTLTGSRLEEEHSPPRQATPLRRTRPLSNERKTQFQSMNNVIQSPLKRLERSCGGLEKMQRDLNEIQRSFGSSTELNANEEKSQSTNAQKVPRRGLRQKPSDLKRSKTDDGLTKRSDLPPTPDTMNTSSLDLDQKPELSEQHVHGLASHKRLNGIIERPRSTDERLIRRETSNSETQSYTTVTDSYKEGVDPWMSLSISDTKLKNRNVRTVDLFDFGDVSDRSKYHREDHLRNRWNESSTRNREVDAASGSPALQLRARRASVADRPAINPLGAHPTNPKREERRIKFDKGTYFETPMRSVSGPSHLASSQVHNTPMSAVSTKVQVNRPTTAEPSVKDSMCTRLTSKIFKRAETFDPQPKQTVGGAKVPKAFNEHIRYSSVEVDRIGDEKGLNVGRPRTAVESRLPISRRKGTFGLDGANDDAEGDVGGVKAWLGIGRRRASFGFGGR